MLQQVLKQPFRLAIIVLLIAAFGIYCGFNLPISLYPQTSKPVVEMNVSYGGYSAEEFIRKYGANIEYQLENIKNTGLPLESVKANYRTTNVYYTVTYDWDVPFTQALKEVQTVAASTKGQLPRESADSISVWQYQENGGFLAVSFYGSKHSLNELYEVLDPILGPELKKISDAEEAILWNPESIEVNIQLLPEKMVLYGLLPGTIYRSIDTALPSLTGGEIRLGSKGLNFQIPSNLTTESNLENHIIKLADGRRIHLKDVAEINVGRSESQTKGFKTNGKESLILFANPKSGANVKRMAEDILSLIKTREHLFPKDVEYRVLVDPSEFIRGSIKSLVKDIILAAFLAVMVLFLFIGNFKNVATVSLEIPLSMVIAFIVMYATGMNLNLISLGGLALAAGMNVDASVVVLENIFRHQEMWNHQNNEPLTAIQRFKLIYGAVSEVAAPIFLSIATTLIVFIPLAMTSDLTHAILGDLAKAVIYSHAVSGFVAIFVVPTIRLALLKRSSGKVSSAPLEKPLSFVSKKYLSVLSRLVGKKGLKPLVAITPVLIAAVLAWTLIPRLPKEIVGTPDTDWLFVSVTAPQSSTPRQMENILQEVESKSLASIGDMVSYTFVQMRQKTYGSVMLRLKDKTDMKKSVEKLQKLLSNTPEIYYYVDAWNPAELPLPQMNHLEVSLSGKNTEDIRMAVSRLKYFLNEKGDYKRISTTPSSPNSKLHQFVPFEHVWSALLAQGSTLSLVDVLDLTLYANQGKSPGSMMIKGKMTPVTLRFADERFQNPDLLAAYPFKINGKVVPLAALGRFETVEAPTEIFRQDGREKAIVRSTLDKDDEKGWEALATKYAGLIIGQVKDITNGKDVSVEMVQPKKELFAALEQLKFSLAISLALIFLVLWLQFESIKQVLVIMMTIPLGLIGALIALTIFNSTLSLNSALGVILLNGIAVNNAILLVEVYNQLLDKGVGAHEAIMEACRSRLRPILITSLTTCLGMLPIALGWGDGGKILQPLGITVTFGLLFSTAISLLIVPIALFRKEDTRGEKLKENDPTPPKTNNKKSTVPDERVWQ